MWNWIKRLVAGKELDALRRYQTACHLVYRWNGQLPNSSETAQWISMVGEGSLGQDISGFRNALESGDSRQIELFMMVSAVNKDHLTHKDLPG